MAPSNPACLSAHAGYGLADAALLRCRKPDGAIPLCSMDHYT
jgi:hypothetical protein